MELNWKKVEMNENKLHNNCTLKIFRYPYVRHTVNSCIAAECDYGTCMLHVITQCKEHRRISLRSAHWFNCKTQL